MKMLIDIVTNNKNLIHLLNLSLKTIVKITKKEIASRSLKFRVSYFY